MTAEITSQTTENPPTLCETFSESDEWLLISSAEVERGFSVLNRGTHRLSSENLNAIKRIKAMHFRKKI